MHQSLVQMRFQAESHQSRPMKIKTKMGQQLLIQQTEIKLGSGSGYEQGYSSTDDPTISLGEKTKFWTTAASASGARVRQHILTRIWPKEKTNLTKIRQSPGEYDDEKTKQS